MKRVFMLFFCAVVLILYACQPTPEEDIVVNKGDGTLESAIAATPAPGASMEPAYKAPARFQDEYVHENVYISADADISVNPVAVYPVLRVKNAELTQGMAERFVTALVGERTLSNGNLPYTKAELSRQMLEAILHYQRDDEDFDESIKSEEDLRSFYEGLIAQAPETVDGDAEIDLATLSGGFTARVDTEASYDAWLIMDDYDDLGIVAYYKNNGDTAMQMFDENHAPKEIAISREDAQTLAEQTVAALGLRDMALYYYEPYIQIAPDEDRTQDLGTKFSAHRFIFTRSVAGTPVTYTTVGQANSSEQYASTWYTEEIEVQVDDAGVVYLSWQGGMDVLDTVNENVSLLSFDEIMKNAYTQLYLTNPYADFLSDGKGCVRFAIKAIKLGYMRVHEKNNPDGSFLIPVWDFMGVTQLGAKSGDEIEWGEAWDYAPTVSLLTINAIDGSAINRSLGY